MGVEIDDSEEVGSAVALSDVLNVASPSTDPRRALTHPFGTRRAFGGQVLGLAVASAARSVAPDRTIRCVHGQLVGSGHAGEEVHIANSTLRDGRTSSHRRVVVSQRGRQIAYVDISFATGSTEEATSDGSSLFSLPGSVDENSQFARLWGFRQLEFNHPVRRGGRPALHPVWVRARQPLPATPEAYSAALVFVSDLGLVAEAIDRNERETLLPVSFDHTVWFHQKPSFDDWCLLDVTGVERTGSAALVRARVLSATGAVLASVVQGVTLLAQ